MGVKKFEDQWLDPVERRARILLAGKSRGLANIGQIAKQCGMPRETVYRMSRAKYPNSRAVAQLAFGLEVTTDYLLMK